MSLRKRFIVICFPALLTAALSVGTNRATMAQQVIGKKCDACGAAVSLAAQVGQTCPHCGEYWGYQKETYVPGYSQPSYSYRGTAMDRWLLWQLMLQQRQMQLRQERQTRLELRAAAFRKFDERDRRIRERRRAELIAQMETRRSKDDPQKLAAHYLADGLECEGKGDTKTAASYYKLAMQTLPNSVWANTATGALRRLGGDVMGLVGLPGDMVPMERGRGVDSLSSACGRTRCVFAIADNVTLNSAKISDAAECDDGKKADHGETAHKPSHCALVHRFGPTRRPVKSVGGTLSTSRQWGDQALIITPANALLLPL